MTRRAFVIGHPIAHSRSPIIHRHWLEKYAIDGSYEAIDVAPENLPNFFNRIRTGEFVGGNVTVPIKELAYQLCDVAERASAEVSATNTITTHTSAGEVRLHGDNTDIYGFLANLDANAPGWDKSPGAAIVLGAGGAARAIISALTERGLTSIRILNRTEDKAKNLAKDLAGPLTGHSLQAFAQLAPTASLLINTTTIGMNGTAFSDLPLEILPKTALVTDIVYVPLKTPLLEEASTLGLKTVHGLGMLLHQAVPGFEAWFGTRPEVTDELFDLVLSTLNDPKG